MPTRQSVNVANNLKQTPIPVVPSTLQLVNSDGTVTRSGKLLLQQLQAPTTIQGTHAARPDPGQTQDGAVYVESDRTVLYANINGAWHYIAGTCWGTFSPDQRPKDLGANDAGFDFRTVDQPAREFIWSQVSWIETTPARFGTHAQRLAVNVAQVIEQMLWFETDRTVLYMLEASGWVYVSGTMQTTQAGIPTDLGSGDAGFLCSVTDYAHLLTWSGSIWKWGPGEIGSAYFMDFAVAPGAGWHICDGSSVSYLKSDGTLSSGIILPNTNGSPAYRKLGSAYAGAITGAAAPTFTGAALAAHHHQMPFSQNGANLVMNLGLFGAGGAGYTATISAALVGSSLTGSCVFTDSVSPGTPSGSVTLAGDPVSNFEAMQYFRL